MTQILKRSRFWSIVIALLMAAQLALAFHTLEHKFDPSSALGDDCALCQVAHTMAPAPADDVFTPPTLEVFAQTVVPLTTQLLAAAPAAAFRSRAPPVSVSV